MIRLAFLHQIGEMKEDFYNAVPYSLSEGSRRPIHWNGFQGEGGNRCGMSCSVYIHCNCTMCEIKEMNKKKEAPLGSANILKKHGKFT